MTSDEEKKKRISQLLEIQKNIRQARRTVKDFLSVHSSEVVDHRNVIQFSNRISYTLHAPPNWQYGAWLSTYPPAPQIENMRKGKLGYQLVKIGETAKGSIVSAINEEMRRATLAKALSNQPSSGPQKRDREHEDAPAEVPIKRRRAIGVNFGFDSDSD
jgi:hypothetical protein